MAKKYTIDNFIQESKKDSEFTKLYKKEEILNDIARTIVVERKKKGLTQKDLANLISTKQSSISRLETKLNKQLPSLEFLYKIATCLEKNIKVSFI